MVLDARLLLAGQPVGRITPVDPIEAQLRAFQLQGAAQGIELQGMQLQGARQAQADERALRQVYSQALEPDPQTGAMRLNEDKLVAGYAQVAPGKALTLKASLAKSQREVSEAQLKQWEQQNAMIGQLTFGLLAAEDRGEDPQPLYLRALATLASHGVPVQHMSPRYDRTVVQQHLDQALTSKERLEQLKAQRDASKIDYGLGPDVNAAVYGQAGAQIAQQPGGRPTPEQVQAARQTIAGEKLQRAESLGALAAGRTAEMERAKIGAQKDMQGRAQLLDVRPRDFAQFIDWATGLPVDPTSSYDVVRQAMAGPQKQIVYLSDEQYKDWQGMRSALKELQGMRATLEKVYGPGGAFENLSAGQRPGAAVAGWFARAMQTDPDLTAAAERIKANVEFLQRQLKNQRGAGTEGDVARGLRSFPELERLPDSAAVAQEKFNALLESTTGIMRELVQNPELQIPGLEPVQWTRPAGQRPAGQPPSSGQRMTEEEAIARIMKAKKYTREQAQQFIKENTRN
jgi:hypothetical protein